MLCYVGIINQVIDIQAQIAKPVSKSLSGTSQLKKSPTPAVSTAASQQNKLKTPAGQLNKQQQQHIPAGGQKQGKQQVYVAAAASVTAGLINKQHTTAAAGGKPQIHQHPQQNKNIQAQNLAGGQKSVASAQQQQRSK